MQRRNPVPSERLRLASPNGLEMPGTEKVVEEISVQL